jgi:hypothetical protein
MARWILAGYLGSIYFDSAIHKLTWPMWSHGFGLAAPMMLPNLVWMPAGWMALFPVWLWRLLGYGVVVFELTFFLFYAFRRTRVALLLTGMAMHGRQY